MPLLLARGVYHIVFLLLLDIGNLDIVLGQLASFCVPLGFNSGGWGVNDV